MSAQPTTVWINARFLDRPVSGVERVARELLAAVATRLEADGTWTTPQGKRLRFQLIAPANSKTMSPWPQLNLVLKGKTGGHLWEQGRLAVTTHGEWLISLCNTGPVFKRKHLLFLHDAQTFAIPQNFTWKFRLWYQLLFNIAGRMASIVMTNSEYSRNELVKHVGLEKSHIVATWLGVEHVLRVQPDESIFIKQSLPHKGYLLAVSSVNPNKNFAAVIRALELLGTEAPPCVIAGQRYARVFGHANLDEQKTTHVGHVSDAELYALYSRAEALLFPSYYEGFGLPPVEAMALGCPAIVSQASVLPEICGDAALYCDPAKPETLAEAIRQLRSQPDLRDGLIAKGKQRAKLFSWAKGADELLDALSKAIDQEP